MTWLRWLRAWFTTRSNLIAQVIELTEAVEWAARRKRRDDARHELELEMARAGVAALHAEIESLRGEVETLLSASETLIDLNRRERVWGNTLAHRIAAAHHFADRLPPDVAADLRGCLSPAFPAAPEEATSAR